MHTLKSRPLFETMQEVGPTVILGMPRFFRLLYDSIQQHHQEEEKALPQQAQELFGGKLRFLISGGAALDPALYDAFHQWGLTIYAGYGLTESAPVLTVNPPEQSKKGSVGLPLPGVEVRIDKPDAQGVGEIIVRGPGIMNGYFHNPTATAKVLKDGWLYTGDLGYQDTKGYLYITGHSKEVIASDTGKHTYPQEIPLASPSPWAPQTWEERVVVQELVRFTGRSAEQIHPTHQLEFDLGLDSLKKVELLVQLETHFQDSFPEQLLGTLCTVQDALEAVKKYQKRPRKRKNSDKEGAVLAPGLLAQNPSPFYRITTRLFNLCLRTTYHWYFHLQCQGLEHLPRGIPYIIAANHTSHLDSGAVITAVGKEAERLYILGARDYFFTNSWKGWFVHTFLHVIPFDRHEKILQSIRISQEVLTQGKALLIYPEGTRSITGELQSFKKGLGFLACETGAPIVPAYIHGTYTALPKGKLFPKRSHITVRFGVPVLSARYRDRKKKVPHHSLYQEITDRVRASIEELHAQHLRED
jgi:long-chain acyl-CoA synthetase